MIERLIQLVIEILKQLFGIDDKNYNWNSTIENGEETQNISGTNESREIGEQGENKVAEVLQQFNGVVLRKLYVPTNGSVSDTEIDVLLVHETGLYVIEVKNYSGYIIGEDESNNWTACYGGKGNFSFYSPVKQNEGHLRVLKRHLTGLPDYCYCSLVCFGEKATLDRVAINSCIVTTVNELKSVINNEVVKRKEQGIYVNVDGVVNILKQFENATEERKQRHINEINNQFR